MSRFIGTTRTGYNLNIRQLTTLRFITLRAKLRRSVYCNRPCLFVCLFVGLLPR